MPLAEVVRLLVHQEVKAAPVVDEQRRPVGVVDRHHLLRVLMQENEDDVRD